MKNSEFPDYKRIYTDLIAACYPNKKEQCSCILSQDHLSALDVIKLNEILTSNSETDHVLSNQSFRSYDQVTILKILDYQKKNRLNNTQISNHFKLSRNTVTKWKKKFLY
ncbi:helix-turn-helix domain-containing protein [Chryseobacterium tructae]|uniref:Helix-turn-helix domain-containing protein n=1 Tax=Chryseobacterium tructae TaxID=1037380 RepID=A0ABV7Y0D7_9FLAO|nr:helix-turn-helix domain-containing protein [Chryseobacterium tructae]MDN3693716.1 helix-turn-helix domain-containing protein [Chryseobacterium tructae]